MIVAGLLLCGTCSAQTWGSIGAGYIQQLTETRPATWTTVHGWYLLGNLNITRRLTLYADIPNFYGPGENVHVQLYGPAYSFPNKTRVTPFVFIGPGFVRDSRNGTVTTSFAWCVGGGFLVRITRWVSFQTIPVEYVMNIPNGKVVNNFVQRAGFALTIPKK